MQSFKVKVFHIPGDRYGNWYFQEGTYTSMDRLLDKIFLDSKADPKINRLLELDNRNRITYLTLAVAMDEKLVGWSACSVLDQCSRRYGFLIALNRLAHELEFEKGNLRGCRLYAKDVLYFADDSDLKDETPDPGLATAIRLGDIKKLLKEEQVLASARNAKRLVIEARRLEQQIANSTQKLSKIKNTLTSQFPPVEELRV